MNNIYKLAGKFESDFHKKGGGTPFNDNPIHREAMNLLNSYASHASKMHSIPRNTLIELFANVFNFGLSVGAGAKEEELTGEVRRIQAPEWVDQMLNPEEPEVPADPNS